jgi:phosphate transport system permease protein
LSGTITFLALLALVAIAWAMARAKARGLTPDRGKLRHSLPGHYGLYVALWALIPGLLMFALWSAISPGLIHTAIMASPAAASLPAMDMDRDAIISEAYQLAKTPGAAAFNPQAQTLIEPVRAALQKFGLIGAILSLLVAFSGGGWGFTRIKSAFPARSKVERMVLAILLAASFAAVLTTIGIVASLLFETGRFFSMISPLDFLTGTQWVPQDGSGPETSKFFGALPLFWGTIFIGAIIAMIVAIPLGLMSAIYLTQYASYTMRKWVKPLLEILAGIPTVVYGYFAALTVAPAVRDFAAWAGAENPSTESALAAGLVMGVMIIPFVSSMADDSIAAVPQSMRDGSLAMGATTSETIKRVMIPAALPGIVAGVMLAISRAIGETMIVVMAAGATARFSLNPFDSMTTVTFQINQLLTGDQAFDGAKTLSAFALGLVLFVVTLVLNIIALRVVKRFREAYD